MRLVEILGPEEVAESLGRRRECVSSGVNVDRESQMRDSLQIPVARQEQRLGLEVSVDHTMLGEL